MGIQKLIKKVKKKFGTLINVEVNDRSIILRGEMDNYQDIVEVGYMFVDKKKHKHVVNEINLKGHHQPEETNLIYDKKYDQKDIDVLIIGGGIIGCTILRQLSKYDCNCLLIEKEADVAFGASGANDGMIHSGIDLKKNSIKAKYCYKGNKMYDQLAEELDFDFLRCGQYLVFSNKTDKILAHYLLHRSKKLYIAGVEKIKIEELKKSEPNLKDYHGAIKLKNTGVISPYKACISFLENAIMNKAEVAFETACLKMVVQNNQIEKVITNRGVIIPKVVINCAGIFADKVAKMADDQYYSIHPRKGTDIIFDKKANYVNTIISGFPKISPNKTRTKGGGIVRTVDGNILIGPDVEEVIDRTDTKTTIESINRVFSKHQKMIRQMNKQDIISYFSGLRAATYEEDFIVEVSKKVPNFIHVAGIQSPGLTSAPAIAVDVSNMALDLLKNKIEVKIRQDFNPYRKRIIEANKLTNEERHELIKKDPDYGKIICRCEEISYKEIKDAIHSIVPATSIDAIKRRVRCGMGRCQGSFCLPLILKIISEELNVDINKVNKRGSKTNIGLYHTKEQGGEKSDL